MKKNILFLFFILPMFVMAQVATDGDYRSVTTGNWNTPATWQVRSGGVWSTATVVPTAANNVYIQNGHTVTLNTSVSSDDGLCNDIQVNILGVLAISGSNNVNVSGKIRAYTGTAETSGIDGTYTGTSSTSPSGITTGSTGVLKFVGISRNITNTGEWNSTGITCNAEFALNTGATGTLLTGIKFKRITITACTITTASFIAVGSVATDFIRLTTGARLISSRTGTNNAIIGGSSVTKCGIVQIDEGAVLEVTGSTPTMDCTTFTNNGTVLYSRSGAQIFLAPTVNAAPDAPITLPNYSNLIIAGSSAKTLPPGLAVNVSNSLSLAGASTAILANGGGSSLTYSAGATFVDSSTASIVLTPASLEWPAASGPTNIRVVSNTLSFTASAGISRTITGNLTLNGGNFSINSGNTLTFANGSGITRSATGSLNINSGTLNHGTSSTDLVNITINFNCTNSAEISSSIAPGKIGTLTIASGASYTNTGGRTVTNLVNNGVLVLTPATTLTLSVSGTISGTGTITSNLSTANAINYYSSSLSFTGSTAIGSLLMTPGLNTVRNLTLNNIGGLSLGNAIKVDTTLILTAGPLTTGGNLTLGNGTSIVRTAGMISAAPVFGTSVNVTYNDINATTTGSELPASSTVLNNLIINNSNGVLLNTSPAVNGTLTLSSGALSIGANTLTLNGAVSTTSGTITGSSSSNLVIGGVAGTLNFTQTTAATRSINNLTLNNAATATLGTALDVYGTIALTTASLNLNTRALTLKSNATGTARIADLTGSTITGATNVTMERWIPLRGNSATGGRAYRLLAPTVNTSGSIKDNWMEGGMNTTIGTNVDPLATFGTQISGASGNANGFDVTQSNASSLYTAVNAVTPTYTAVANTSSSLNALTGYFLYIRGDRSVNMQVPLATNMPTTSTTLRTTGMLVTGTQTIFTNAYTGGGALNLVTNPYPSPIDWSLVRAASSNITNFYTLWDPNMGTRGGFVTVNTAGVPSSGTANQYIQPGQAFFVEHDNVGPNPLVSIQENHKTAGNNNTVFIVEPAPIQSFKVGLFFTEDLGYRRQADGVNVLYDNAYSADVNAEDAKEINNWDENIAINRENKHLAIEGRPVIKKSDNIPLFMNNMKQKAYEFEFTPSAFTNTNLKAELVDNFLNTRTLLSVTVPSVVRFTITANPASAAANRFTVEFGKKPVIDILTVNAKARNNAVLIEWVSKTENEMQRYEVERSFNNSSFTKINTTTAMADNSAGVDYSFADATAQVGDNFYRIKAIDKTGQVTYSGIAKLNFGKIDKTVNISPNPVTGNIIKLQLSNVEKGIYQVQVYNNQGQVVYSMLLQHAGGSTTVPVTLENALSNGIYKLVLTGKNIRTTNGFIKN